MKDREESSDYNKQWRLEHPEYHKEYYIKNKEKIIEYKKQWRENNPKYNKQYYENNLRSFKQYRSDHQEQRNQYSKQWNIEHPGYKKQYAIEHKNERKIYQEENKEKIRKQHRQYVNLKQKSNLKYNLNQRIATAIYLSLKGNKAGRHWEILVGYTLNDLIKWLKKTMPKNYTWQDYLEGKLHIDHRIPISAHNFTKSEHIDFKNCWALSNLQLLPKKENLIKYNKLGRPFQPALQI